MAVVIPNHFLCSVLSQPSGGLLPDADLFRRYRSVVHSSAVIHGRPDSLLSQICYSVGRAVATKGAALAHRADGALTVEATYNTAGVLAEDFVVLARRHTNFTADFAYTSLAGVVERLGRTLAACSLFGDITSADIRGGQTLVVNALGPFNSVTTTVFIPRLANSTITGDVFSVLVNAIAGEGSTVATDVVGLDANTRQPLIPTVGADGMASAVVDALRVLGANMMACDQGPLYALALTRGVHRVVSVTGHTEEGAIIRDLFRSSGFSSPYGGIHYGLEPYAGLPALSSDSPTSIAAFVDTLALTTAALVGHCDPGVTYDGRWYPTILLGASADDATRKPGDHTDGSAAMANRNRAQLLAEIPRFAAVYIPGLGKLFSAAGDASLACDVLCAAATDLQLNPARLRHATVAPWFWVEPTSLLPHDFLGSRAELEGFASLAGAGVTRSRPAWEDIVPAGPSDVACSGYYAVMRSARTSWFFHHWRNDPANGLNSISVRQLDPNSIIHPGPNDERPQVRDRIEAMDTFDNFLWTRGQSPFCAPSELVNISGTVGFYVKHITFDDEARPDMANVPTAAEFLNTVVTVTIGRPMGVVSGACAQPAPGARRSKTSATRELNAALTRSRIYGRSDVARMATSFTAPVMRASEHPRATR